MPHSIQFILKNAKRFYCQLSFLPQKYWYLHQDIFLELGNPLFFRLNCFIFKILTAWRMKLAELTFFLQRAMSKRIWNRVFCSHKLNALCAVLLKSNFARASSYVLDNNLANYLEFLLYACPSSLSRMNTRLSFFGTSFTDHSCKHTCFLSGFKKYLNVFFFSKTRMTLTWRIRRNMEYFFFLELVFWY